MLSLYNLATIITKINLAEAVQMELDEDVNPVQPILHDEGQPQGPEVARADQMEQPLHHSHTVTGNLKGA